jgi:hypothetical protein
MNDDVVVFRENHPGLILERRWRGLDEVEEPVSSRLDMGAMLNVVGDQNRSVALWSRLLNRVSNASSTTALFFSPFELLIVFLSYKSTLDVFVVNGCMKRVQVVRRHRDSRSDLPSAAINEKFDTRDETGVIRS